MAAFISGFDEQNKRISTQQLLQKIYAALDQGETEFEILASGHHDIGVTILYDSCCVPD